MNGVDLLRFERSTVDLAGALQALVGRSEGFTGGEWFFGVEGREYLPGELTLPDVQDRVLGAASRVALERGWVLRVSFTAPSCASVVTPAGVLRATRDLPVTAAACALRLAIDANPALQVTRHVLPRYERGPLWPYRVRPLVVVGSVVRTVTPPPRRKAGVSTHILTLLRQKPGLTTAEIARELGRQARFVGAMLSYLLSRGQVRREGTGGAFDPFRYWRTA